LIDDRIALPRAACDGWDVAKDVPISMPPEGTVTLVVVGDVPYAVVAHEGKPCAFVASCSHKDLALVPLRLKKGALVCPHHGARFDPRTGACVDDAGKDVPTGLPSVEVQTTPEGGFVLRARKRHRKLLSRKARKKLRAGRDT
jgi:nitrite reductase/ring-hydroxylating ferredoxin subunit